MTRNTAREIAVHLSYEMNFTNLTAGELLDQRLTAEDVAKITDITKSETGYAAGSIKIMAAD